MKNKNRIAALILAIAMLFTLAACSGKIDPPSDTGTNPVNTAPEIDYDAVYDVNVGMLKGPTGIGATLIMEKSALGETPNNYTFTVSSTPTEILSRIISGELDIAAVPTNAASILYNKTEGDVQIIALNTLGVLYILTGEGIDVDSISDLRGKTIYATGQGANPEYVLKYLLEKNGLVPGSDVFIEFREGDEIAALMASGEIDVCMLPVPNATSVLLNNDKIKSAIDLTEEWNKVTDDGSVLTMGCIVVRREFAENYPLAVDRFLAEYEMSIDYVTSMPAEASELVAKFELTGSAKIAEAAIPDCNLVWITGEDIKPAIEGYFEVLFDADPASIGGAMPDDDFYYQSIYY